MADCRNKGNSYWPYCEKTSASQNEMTRNNKKPSNLLDLVATCFAQFVNQITNVAAESARLSSKDHPN